LQFHPEHHFHALVRAGWKGKRRDGVKSRIGFNQAQIFLDANQRDFRMRVKVAQIRKKRGVLKIITQGIRF